MDDNTAANPTPAPVEDASKPAEAQPAAATGEGPEAHINIKVKNQVRRL